MPRYSTQHYSTLQYTTLITPQLHLQLQLKTATTTTPTTTTTTALQHTTSSSCGEVTTATIATTPENTTPTTSNHLSVHQWIRSAIRDSQQPTSPIGLLFLKLPPPPCAVLLVWCSYMYFAVPVSITSCGTWAVLYKVWWYICTNYPWNITTLPSPWTSHWFEVSQCLYLKETKRPICWLYLIMFFLLRCVSIGHWAIRWMLQYVWICFNSRVESEPAQAIPSNVDVLLVHGPPLGRGDALLPSLKRRGCMASWCQYDNMIQYVSLQ